MKKIIGILGVFILFIFIFTRSTSKQTENLFSNYAIQKTRIGKTVYTLYVADTQEKRNKGLSDVQSLPVNSGMIFIFPNKGKYEFWMKDMKMSLDFIFVDGTKIVDSLFSINPDTYPRIIKGSSQYNKVIEIPHGLVTTTNATDVEFLN